MSSAEGELSELRGQTAAEAAAAEQRSFEQSSRIADLERELDAATRSKAAIQGALRLSEAEALSRRNAQAEAESKLSQLQLSLEDAGRQLRQRAEEKDSLNKLLATRADANQELKHEVSRLKKELDAGTAEKLRAVIALEEEKAAQHRATFLEQRFAEERRQMEEEHRWLRTQKAEAEERLNNARSEARAKDMDAAAATSQLQDALAMAERALAESKEGEETLSQQLHQLNLRLRNAQSDAAESRREYEKELECQKKLAEMFRSSSAEAEGKVEELVEALSSVTKVYEESKATVLSVKAELERETADSEAALAAAKAETARTKEDLDKASELLRSKHRVMLTDEEVAALSPGAAAASRLIRDGRSLTNIYRDHSRVVEELDASKCENRRLEAYILEIVNDIQSKAPRLREQRREYEEMKDSNKGYQNQLRQAAAEQKELSERADGTLRELKYTKAELERYQRDNGDLSRQLRTLVCFVEACRAGLADPRDDADRQPSAEELLIFRNVDELQALNQRLMSQLREAETKREELIKAAQEEELGKLQGELEGALKEVSSLTKHRANHEAIINSLSNQRDEMKRLYLDEKEKRGAAVHPETETASELSAAPGDRRLSADKSTLLDHVEKEFAIFRNEKAEVDKINEEKIAGLTKRVGELSATNAKLGADIVYAEERFKALDVNTDTYKKDAARLRDRLAKSDADAAKAQQKVADLTNRLLDIQDTVAQERVAARGLKEALDTSRARETELSVRLESMRSAEQSQRSLVSLTQELQHRVERLDAQANLNAQTELDSIRKDKKTLTDALTALEEKNALFVQATQGEMGDLKGELMSETARAESAERRCRLAEEAAKELEEKLATAGLELEEVRGSGKDASAERFQKENHQLQTRFNYLELQSREKNVLLEKTAEELGRAKKELAHYEAMSETMEETMRKEKDTGAAVSTQLKDELNAVRSARDEALVREADAQRQLTTLRLEKEDLAAQHARLQTDSVAEAAALSASIAAKETEVADWAEKEAKARQDRDHFAASVLKLETDIGGLNSRLVTLQTNSDEQAALLDVKDGKIRQLSQDMDTRLKEINLLTSSQSELQAHANAEKADIVARVKTLEDTNEALTVKIAELGSIISAYESAAGGAAPTGGEASAELSEQSASALMEVLTHLRAEKSRAEERSGEAESEADRLRSRLRLLEEEIVAKRLETERRREVENSLSEAAAEKTKLLAQLQSLTELQSANTALNAQIAQLQGALAALEASVLEERATGSRLAADKQNTETRLGKLERELGARTEELATWRRRYDELVQQRAAVESQQLVELRKDLSGKEAKLKEADGLRSQLIEAERTLDVTKTTADKDREQLEGAVADHKSKLIDLQQRLDSAESESLKNQKTLSQARQLALKYKKMYTDIKGSEGEASTPAAAAVTPAADSAEAKAAIAELGTLKEELTALKAERDALRRQVDEAAGRATEQQSKLDALQSSIRSQREATGLTAQKLVDGEKERKRLEAELVETKKKVEDGERAASELKETQQRMRALERAMKTSGSKSGGSGVSEEDTAVVQPVVQPVVPQPSQSVKQPSEPSGPSPPVPAGPSQPRRIRQVASVQPSQPIVIRGGRQQALVPPSAVSPGPALPDQSSSSTGPTQASVPPMQMAVSTTGHHPLPVPHAVISPHHPQQEQVSGSSDIVSAGPGSLSASSSSARFNGDAGAAPSTSSTTSRKRLGPLGIGGEKRLRTDADEQVSTSDPVLPFSHGNVGPEEALDEFPNEEIGDDEDAGDEAAQLPEQEDSSDDDIMDEPEDIGIHDEDVGDDGEDEEDDSEDDEPNDLVESTGSDVELRHGEDNDDEDDDDDIQILSDEGEDSLMGGEAIPAAESSGDTGDLEGGAEASLGAQEESNEGGDGGSELPLGDGIVPSAPSFAGIGLGLGSMGTRHVPESSSAAASLDVRSGSPPDEGIADEGIESDSGCASSTVGPRSSFLPAPEEAPNLADEAAGKDPSDNDEEPSTSQGSASQERRAIKIRRPIVWDAPSSNDGPPDLSAAAEPSPAQPRPGPLGRGRAQGARKTMARSRPFRGGAFKKT